MDHNNPQSEGAGLNYAVLSIMLMIFNWISLQSVQTVLSVIATVVSITAGTLAARHYYLLHKKPNKES